MSESSRARASVRPPAPILVAAGLILLEAVVVLILGVLEAVSTQSDRAIVGVGVGGAILLVLYATWLVVIAWGLRRLRMWARGMAVATQVVLLPAAWSSFWGGPTTWMAVVLAVMALTVIGCLVSPPATRALVPESMRRKAVNRSG